MYQQKFINEFKSQTIKKSGAQPSDKPKAALPLCFESVDYSVFPTVQTAEIPMKEIPTAHIVKPAHSVLFAHF